MKIIKVVFALMVATMIISGDAVYLAIDDHTLSTVRWAWYKLISESVSMVVYVIVMIYLLDMALNMQNILR